MRTRVFAALATAASLILAGAAPEPARKPARADKAATRPAPTLPGTRGPDLAYGAYQRGLYLTAYREATARLERDPGDAAAMTLVAELYNQGLGIRQNPTEAAAWYRLAAERGDARAMTTLGLMAMDGRGMTRDPAAGRAWLEKAAALHEPVASYNLALGLMGGGPDDLARAARLLVVAAEAEIADAQHALGVLHSRGQGGVAHDPTEAARLYLRAARNGSIAGSVEFAIALFNGEGVPRNEIGAARHFRVAAARGNAIAQNRLARLYLTGRGVPKNLVEAAAWHLLARSQGLGDSWLEKELAALPEPDRARAEKLASDRSS